VPIPTERITMTSRVYTYSSTGNRFEVIDPAPSIKEFLAGKAARNAHELEVTLSDIDSDRLLDRITSDGILNRASVKVKFDTGFTTFAYASGEYTGAGSELWLTM
jgi:hypothetical protein